MHRLFSIFTGRILPASSSGPSKTTIRSQAVRPTSCTVLSSVVFFTAYFARAFHQYLHYAAQERLILF